MATSDVVMETPAAIQVAANEVSRTLSEVDGSINSPEREKVLINNSSMIIGSK